MVTDHKQKPCQFFAGFLLICMSGCHRSEYSDPWQQSYFIDFNLSANGWSPVFADYPVDQDVFYELAFDWLNLPTPLQDRNGISLAGNNHSDDLLMMIKTQLPSLKPNTVYQVKFSVELATNAGKDCIGIGGSPGESVYIKAGASAVEPARFNQDGYWRLNVDLGQQSAPGVNSVVLGNFASTQSDCVNTSYELKLLPQSSQTAYFVQTNDDSALWLYFLSDSGFEGKTTLYFTRAFIVIEEI